MRVSQMVRRVSCWTSPGSMPLDGRHASASRRDSAGPTTGICATLTKEPHTCKMAASEHPTALVLYHYLYPDDVVSAILFSELSAGLVERGWHVTASSANRAWHNDRETYPRRSVWNGVEFRRVWRPRWRQASGLGRMANAIWMIAAWSLLALNRRVRPQI